MFASCCLTYTFFLKAYSPYFPKHCLSLSVVVYGKPSSSFEPKPYGAALSYHVSTLIMCVSYVSVGFC
jgi:hypothetical protein